MRLHYLHNSQKVPRQILLTLLLAVVCSFGAQAQEMTVKGVVYSSIDNSPIPGASVVGKGSTNGTMTTLDGQYTIHTKKGEMLQFSFIGMKPQTIEVANSTINVTLEVDMVSLGEVVKIGYGTVKKKELTGAVTHVKSDDITRVVTSDLGKSLQGLIAGVNVAASGAPGENSSILIRGVSSISGSNSPLYVVDGVPQESDPGLSTNEIETIDILKDAASCAIYGTRGSAGVILITTKQGKDGAMKVTANASYGIQNITSDIPLMNATEQTYADMVYQRNVNKVSNSAMLLSSLKSPYMYMNNSNIGELILNDYAPVQDYNVTISGGNQALAYSLVAGYYDQEGIIINSGFTRFNTRANTSYKNGKWRIIGSVGMSQEKTERASGTVITNIIKYHPTMDIIDPNDDSPLEISHGSENGRIGSVMESLRNTHETNRTKAFGNFNINYEIIAGLNASVRLGLNTINDYQHRFDPYQEIYDTDGQLQSDPVKDSQVIMGSARKTALTVDAGLTYQKKFEKHKLTAFAGQSYEKYVHESYQAAKSSVVNNSITVLDGAVGNPMASSLDNDYVNILLGSIGRVQYDYMSKYLLSASIRRDGSSKFAKGNRWGIFPSASVAWNISDEKFWEPVSKVANNFKLRASYGTVGNQNINAYSYGTTITPGYDYILGDKVAHGFIMSSYSNPEVKWETSIQSNFGVDLAFFNNKLTVTAEYYHTDKKDMLMPIQLAGSTGSIPNIGMYNPKTSIVYFNIGDMTNQGYELAIGYKAKTGNINWRFNGTFSTNENKVTKVNGSGGYTLLDDSGLISGKRSVSQVTAIAEGYEAGAFFLRRTNGIINSVEKLEKYQKINSNAKMGDVMYVDTNKDDVISDEDRTYAGSGLPEYEIGFNMAMDYRGFDFSMQWYAALGHEIMNGAKATAYGWGRHKDLLYQWSESNPNSTIPAYRGFPQSHPNYEGHTDLWLEDGSFLRLKEVTLGYTLPENLIKKLSISKLRVYISAQNPITITEYTGYDPEVSGNIKSKGLDKGNYPISSLYTAGLSLNF